MLTLASQCSPPSNGRRPGRPRTNTAHSFHERFEPLHEENANAVEPPPIIRSKSPAYEPYADTNGYQRPEVGRASTFEGPTQLRQDGHLSSYSQSPYRTTSENLNSRISTLRPVSRVTSDPYVDHTDAYSHASTSPDAWYGSREQSVSPVPSYGQSSYGRSSPGTVNGNGYIKKGPPPPPPSRAKKPPPPPPMKRPIFAGEGY